MLCISGFITLDKATSLPSEEQMKKDVKAMNATLDKIESAFLKDNMFLTGDEASMWWHHGCEWGEFNDERFRTFV